MESIVKTWMSRLSRRVPIPLIRPECLMFENSPKLRRLNTLLARSFRLALSLLAAATLVIIAKNAGL